MDSFNDTDELAEMLMWLTEEEVPSTPLPVRKINFSNVSSSASARSEGTTPLTTSTDKGKSEVEGKATTMLDSGAGDKAFEELFGPGYALLDSPAPSGTKRKLPQSSLKAGF